MVHHLPSAAKAEHLLHAGYGRGWSTCYSGEAGESQGGRRSRLQTSQAAESHSSRWSQVQRPALHEHLTHTQPIISCLTGCCRHQADLAAVAWLCLSLTAWPIAEHLVLPAGCREEWAKFSGNFASAERAVAVAEGSYAFAYVEGELTRAVREGHWLLLDEVNLGPPEVCTITHC